MKIDDLYKARTLADELRSKKCLIDNLEAAADDPNLKGTINVAIHGKYQEHDVLQACRVPIINALKRQVQKIENDLQAIGVTP